MPARRYEAARRADMDWLQEHRGSGDELDFLARELDELTTQAAFGGLMGEEHDDLERMKQRIHALRIIDEFGQSTEYSEDESIPPEVAAMRDEPDDEYLAQQAMGWGVGVEHEDDEDDEDDAPPPGLTLAPDMDADDIPDAAPPGPTPGPGTGGGAGMTWLRPGQSRKAAVKRRNPTPPEEPGE